MTPPLGNPLPPFESVVTTAVVTGTTVVETATDGANRLANEAGELFEDLGSAVEQVTEELSNFSEQARGQFDALLQSLEALRAAAAMLGPALARVEEIARVNTPIGLARPENLVHISALLSAMHAGQAAADACVGALRQFLSMIRRRDADYIKAELRAVDERAADWFG